MKHTYAFSLLLFFILYAFVSPGQSDSIQKKKKQRASARPTHWSYEGNNAPEKWGVLDPAYALCAEGKHQSPVNITRSEVKKGSNWKFDYKISSLAITHNEHVEDIIDNGHTIQVSVEEGSTFTLNRSTYHLKQFHFHTPAEHTIDGKSFPMEIHFVHQSDSGAFAVVSVLVIPGKENPNLAKLIANLPSQKNETKHLKNADLVLEFHLPKINEAYHYVGSLTTPPCLEQVEWLVFKNPIQASDAQILTFSSLLRSNNRPIQQLNDREVKFDVLQGKINKDE